MYNGKLESRPRTRPRTPHVWAGSCFWKYESILVSMVETNRCRPQMHTWYTVLKVKLPNDDIIAWSLYPSSSSSSSSWDQWGMEGLRRHVLSGRVCKWLVRTGETRVISRMELFAVSVLNHPKLMTCLNSYWCHTMSAILIIVGQTAHRGHSELQRGLQIFTPRKSPENTSIKFPSVHRFPMRWCSRSLDSLSMR